MKHPVLRNAIAFWALALLASTSAWAQMGAQASPADSARGKIGSATVSVRYSSPSVKGRSIWGGLVPYGEVWRSGANDATTFTTDKDLMVEGKRLKAGTYSFFTIPTADKWTVIFNKTAKQWGAFKYDEKQDALRATVKPGKAPSMHERLHYEVTDKGLNLHWENLEVPVAMKEAPAEKAAGGK